MLDDSDALVYSKSQKNRVTLKFLQCPKDVKKAPQIRLDSVGSACFDLLSERSPIVSPKQPSAKLHGELNAMLGEFLPPKEPRLNKNKTASRALVGPPRNLPRLSLQYSHVEPNATSNQQRLHNMPQNSNTKGLLSLGALFKPMVCGFTGYARSFLPDELSNSVQGRALSWYSRMVGDFEPGAYWNRCCRQMVVLVFPHFSFPSS